MDIYQGIDKILETVDDEPITAHEIVEKLGMDPLKSKSIGKLLAGQQDKIEIIRKKGKCNAYLKKHAREVIKPKVPMLEHEQVNQDFLDKLNQVGIDIKHIVFDELFAQVLRLKEQNKLLTEENRRLKKELDELNPIQMPGC